MDAEKLRSLDRDPSVVCMYKEISGLELPMHVFFPKDHKPQHKKTAVVCIHGGAWRARTGNEDWDGGYMKPIAAYFADRGAVGVAISYRDIYFRREDDEGLLETTTLFHLYSDCRSAIRYLRNRSEELGIDPDKIIVIGDSAGGHLAACLGTIDRYDDPYDDIAVSAMANVVVACNPIMDLTDSKWFKYIGSMPTQWEKENISRHERAKMISPIYNISYNTVPMFVIHGLQDNTVQPWHSMEFYNRMNEEGKHCEIKLLPMARHAFILPGYYYDITHTVEALKAIDMFIVTQGLLK